MVIEKRDLVKCVLLTIITCGIYGIYWGVKLGKDAVHVKDMNDDGLLEVLLIIFLPFVGFYLAEKKLTDGLHEKGIEHNDNSIIYLVIGIFGFGIVDYILMQNDLNKLVDAGFDLSGNSFYSNPAGAPYSQNQPPYQQGYNQNGAPYQQNGAPYQNANPQQGYQQAPYQNPNPNPNPQQSAQNNPYDPYHDNNQNGQNG